jgi:hypothetical protein
MVYAALSILGVAAVVVAFQLLTVISRQRRKLALSDVADIIERHADGTEGPYDWDEFTSVPIADPRLDEVRRRCIRLDILVLPDQRRCELRKIVDELRGRQHRTNDRA